MRIKQTIPTYTVGQRVTVLDDLNLRERAVSPDAGLGSWNGRTMTRYQGTVVTISRVNDIFYIIENDGGEFSWSPNMFKESYDFDQVLLTPVPVYHEGQIVRIHNNLSLGREFHNISINSDMRTKQGRLARIRQTIINDPIVYKLSFIDETDACPWSWTATCFEQSYTSVSSIGLAQEINQALEQNKEKEEEFTIDDIKPGMFLFHSQYCSFNSRHIIAVVKKIEDNRIFLRYIHKDAVKRYLSDRGVSLSQTKVTSDLVLECLNDISYSSPLDYTIEIFKTHNRQYIATNIYVPTEEDLSLIYNLSNKNITDEVLKEGMLKVPNLFSDSKFKLKKIDVYTGKLRYIDIYAFHIKDFLYVGIISPGVYKTLKVDTVIKSNTIEIKDYKDILVNTTTAKIKSFEDSATIFGHKTRKEAMFKSIKEGSKAKTAFKIHNLIFNYEKEGKYYHVAEVNDGTLNLKFLLSDLELILPNINNYVFPKERTIKTETICKVTKDKLLPVKKGSEVKVVKMFNRHIPVKGTYDKNTVCVVTDINNKQFECKLHQLKRL